MTGMSRAGKYRVGDRIVYVKPKRSTHPGPRAEHVHPAVHGDSYGYTVDKYWIVTCVADEQTIVAKTRRGKTHRVAIDDPCLRKPNLLERLLCRGRFPSLDTPETGEGEDLAGGRVDNHGTS